MTFEETIVAGGVVVFPADTVYGLACDPESETAVERLYTLKGRPPDKPAAVMFFAVEPALEAVVTGPRTRAALRRLLPGGVTLLLPNPERRFPLACTTDPQTLGVRVPFLAPVGRPLLQTSANLAGGADARRLEEVPESIRGGADLVIDGGELPGVPSTVVDLRRPGEWSIVRQGAVSRDAVARALDRRR